MISTTHARLVRGIVIAAMLTHCVGQGAAQTCPPRWTAGLFPGNQGIEGFLNCGVAAPTGDPYAQFYVAGQFTMAGGVVANSVAAWNGVQWLPVGGGLGTGAYVSELVYFDDGAGPSLHAIGSFNVNGVRRVARWTGAAWEQLGGGVNSGPQCAAVQDFGSGQRLFVGGGFSRADGNPAYNMAVWDGGNWHALTPQLNGRVFSMLAINDEHGPGVIVSGTFTAAGSTVLNRIARWTGEEWLPLGAGFSGTSGFASTMHEFDDGTGAKLYVGGSFSSVGGVAASKVASWNGQVWEPVDNGLDANGGGAVLALNSFELPEGRRLFAAGVGIINMVNNRSLARWTGTTWVAEDVIISTAAEDLLEVNQDGTPTLVALGYVGPFFRTAGSSSWTNLSPDPGTVDAIVRGAEEGELYATGSFTSLGGTAASNVARWDGAAWSPLGEGLRGTGRAMTWYQGDATAPQLIVAGDFSNGPGTPTFRVARWDGASWLPMSPGINHIVHDLHVWNGELYAGGIFEAPAGRVARWTGSAWVPLGVGVSNEVHAIVSHNDGTGDALYVAGTFASAGGATAFRVARWNGSQWSAVGAGLDNTVYDLAEYSPNGERPRLFAVGSFRFSGFTPVSRIAQWDGTSWQPVGSGLDQYADDLAVVRFADGERLVIDGVFGAAGDVIGDVLAWDGQQYTVVADDVSGPVESMIAIREGAHESLYVAGAIHGVDDVPSGYVARFGQPLDLLADIDADCAVGLSDLAYLLRAFGTCSGDDAFDERADLMADECIDIADLARLLANFGASE